jgi:hypothetical protein
VDGQAVDGGRIELLDDGRRRAVEVEMGGDAGS